MSDQSVAIHTTPVPAGLQVYLLGPPEVKWAGAPLSIPRRQVRALLYYLATRSEPVSRERLCFLFWPDIPDPDARRNLSHLLTHLRNGLPDPDLLLTAGDHVALDAERTWSDAVVLKQLVATSDAERNLGSLRAVIDDLYRDTFLAGFSLPTSPEYEAWIVLERSRLEHLYLEMLDTVIEATVAQGAYDDAIDYARRYLQIDELAETVHRRLIQLYAATGDRNAARRQFEACTAILERELGVSPLPETRAAYQAGLKNESSVSPGAVARLAWTTLPGLDVPLVGRAEALHRLERAFARARQGQGSISLISGEAGIGKSRLMQDVARRLEGQALILTGAAQPSVQPLPYHPLTQALRPALSIEGLTLGVADVWLAEASRLLPELRTLRPGLPAPLPAEPEEARSRLFEALYRLLQALADDFQALLLCLDDLHWADGATLDWLTHLGQRLQTSPILVLGTYRPEAAEAVLQLRHDLARSGVASEIKLTGLDVPAVRQLLDHSIGRQRHTRALAERLQRATGGNPFFLLEILRALLESGTALDDVATSGDIPLPETVREAVQARLSRLTPMARQVLEAGAVLRSTFDFDLVRLTAGRRELETMDSLDELVTRQLLEEHGTSYRFHHDIARRAVETTLSPVRRQLLHRRAGRALERLTPQAVASLAYHFEAGGETERALHYHHLAAQQAEVVFAWHEAEEHLARMLSLLGVLDPDCTQVDCQTRRADVLATRAHLRFLQGRLGERDADLATLTQLAQTSQRPSLHLQALVHRVRYLNLDGKYPEAIAEAETGIALAERLGDDPGRARLLAQVGFAHYFLGEPVPAMTALESALAVAGDEADPETRGRIAHILGYVQLHLSNYAQALGYQREAYACHQAAGDHNRMSWDLTDMGVVHTRLNHLAQAEQCLNEALALARRIGSQPAESYAVNNLGTLHYVRGDYAAALECHTESLVLQRATGSRRGEASALSNIGLVHLALSDVASADVQLRQALTIYEDIGYTRGVVRVWSYLARVLVRQGEFQDALATAERALSVAREIEDRYGQVIGLNILARVHLAVGHPADASERAGEAISLAEAIGVIHGQIFGWATLGQASLELDDVQQAQRHTARAVALLKQHTFTEGPEESVYLAHSQALAVAGQRAEAVTAFCQARAEVWAKARRLSTSEQRRRYLQAWRLAW